MGWNLSRLVLMHSAFFHALRASRSCDAEIVDLRQGAAQIFDVKPDHFLRRFGFFTARKPAMNFSPQGEYAMFWIICAALVAVVAMAIAAPLVRRRDAGDTPTAAYDLRIYRDQLREVGRDMDRRLIDPAEAERLRTEIGRKVLSADRALTRDSAVRRVPGGPAAIAVLLVLLGGAFALYQYLGVPAYPDEPIGKRFAAAQAVYDQRPSQAEAEKTAPKALRPEPDADYTALVSELRETAARNPNDLRGQELLALHEERLGNLVAAKDAMANLIQLKGNQARADDYARLAAVTIEAAGGLITRDAETAMAHALKLNPQNTQARYMAGLLQIQNGRPDRAFPVWAELLAEGPADAPWMAPLRSAIGDLAWLAGQPDYTPPEAPTLPGPDADAMAAAQDMTPEQRQQMVLGMVQGLESRLATQGGTPQEWARLISALGVLGQNDRASAILSEARTHFAATPEALQIINAAAQKSGLK